MTTSTTRFRRPIITPWPVSSTTRFTRISERSEEVVDEYTKLENDLDEKQKILQEENQSLTNELSRSLAFQTANYLEGVYDVTSRKRDIAQVVEQRKLDFELLDRWIKYMAKPTDKYKNKVGGRP